MYSGRVGCVGEWKVARFGGVEMADGVSFSETATCTSCAVSIDYHSSSVLCLCACVYCICVHLCHLFLPLTLGKLDRQ